MNQSLPWLKLSAAPSSWRCASWRGWKWFPQEMPKTPPGKLEKMWKRCGKHQRSTILESLFHTFSTFWYFLGGCQKGEIVVWKKGMFTLFMGFVAQTKTQKTLILCWKNTRCFLQQHVFLVQVICFFRPEKKWTWQVDSFLVHFWKGQTSRQAVVSHHGYPLTIKHGRSPI